MIFIAGISISLFLIALLIFKKDKHVPDWILLVWFLFIFVHLLLYYSEFSGFTAKHSFLAGIILPFPLIHGPFLFLYVAALTGRLPSRWVYNLLHFLPFLGVYIYLAEFFVLPGDQKIYILNNQGIGYESFVWMNLLLIILSGIGYITASMVFIRKYQQSIQHEFSFTEKINLTWLQYLAGGLGLIWIVVIFGNETQIFSSVVIYIVIAGFLGIIQHDIFSGSNFRRKISYAPIAPDTVFVDEAATDSQNSSKYQKSGLTDGKRAELKLQLEQLAASEKFYCAPELTLTALADRLDIHPNYLSQYLNEEMGITFYDYINHLRVDEFKRIAVNPENAAYSLLSLAHDCGFSSKSSFNRNFKKITGQTPTQYLKSIKPD